MKEDQWIKIDPTCEKCQVKLEQLVNYLQPYTGQRLMLKLQYQEELDIWHIAEVELDKTQ